MMVETYKDELTEKYWHHLKENLTNWLCIEQVLYPGEEGKDIFVLIFSWLIELGGGRGGGGGWAAELNDGMNLPRLSGLGKVLIVHVSYRIFNRRSQEAELWSVSVIVRFERKKP